MVTDTGQISTPHDLYTAQGTCLVKGELQLHVRAESDRHSLAFVRNGVRVAEVECQNREASSDDRHTVPLSRTLYMVRDKSLGDRMSGGGSRSGDNWFQRGRHWQAAMRTYKTANPSQKQVLFVFQANVVAG